MKRKTKIILVLILISLISNITFASYKSMISGKAIAKLKYPIFLFNSNDFIEGNISSRTNTYYENVFNIFNYLEDEELINETDFEYTIKIIPSTNNFPVKYSLIDLESGAQININSELESDKILLGTTRENHNYKLLVEWDLENNNRDLENNLEVEILIKGVQKE